MPKTPGFMEITALSDNTLERCALKRSGLSRTLDVFLSAVGRRLGAAAAAVETLDEELSRRVFSWKTAPAFDLARTPRRAEVRRAGGLYWFTQPLDVAGRRVGTLAFGFSGAVKAEGELAAAVDAAAEELDGVLMGIYNAAVKQRLMERVTRCLTRSVLREAMDQAVAELHEEIPFLHLGVVYRNEDAAEGERLQYRVYKGLRCVHDSEQRPHRGLDRAVRSMGMDLLDPEKQQVRKLLGMKGGMSFNLGGLARGARNMGKLVAEVDGGLSAFGRDLMSIFANSVSQRLIDYNRERRHMAQFFSPETVSALLQDPDYARKYLSPRVREIGILYVDINSFTKLCERALRRPDRIGDFVDSWSAEAVRLAWKHGGVFDKMVGDCVIALFGPPFFRGTPAENARAAMLAAQEIQAYTARLGRSRKYRGLAKLVGMRGLGVAAGVNLCPAAVGLFGPNKDFTAFSSGMNQTARLQAKGGFRETLVMDSAREAARGAAGKGFVFKGPFEAEAKNVARPLRFYKLKGRGK